jgi:hypothetical protein
LVSNQKVVKPVSPYCTLFKTYFTFFPSLNCLFIAGDGDFASDVSDYKRRKGMSVLLLHPPNAAPALLLAASRTHNFHQLLADVPSRPTNHTPDGGGAQPIGVELELTNLPGPSEQDVKETDRQVSAIVEEYEGSIQAGVLTQVCS